MKKMSAILGLAMLALAASAALPQPDLLLQLHYAGPKKIAASGHASAFTNEFCSPEALALRNQTAGKLSVWLAGWLQSDMGVSVPDGAAKLRPLLDDIQNFEFFFEVRAAANGKPEAAIAIQLDPARAQIWQAALKPFFPVATFKSLNGWLIFDSNPALLALGDRLAREISAPPAGWLDLDINWPRLAQWHPDFKALGLPETQFTLTAPDEYFRINGKFFFPGNLDIKLDDWQMPAKSIHTPFNSFTAIRGFASWYQSQDWAQPYQISPVPNQLFVWSLPAFPFQTYAAIPVPDAARAVMQAYARLAPRIADADARNYFMSAITPELTNNTIKFVGVPFVGLQLKALTEPDGQFLFGEMIPNLPHARPLPPELYRRLATKDLVFYHWELSSNRIPQLNQVTQLGLVTTTHKQLGGNSAAYKWLVNTAKDLGNTDTEITMSGPAEFTFARKTQGILTGMELYALANWLEAPDFPGFSNKMPPRMHHPRPFQLTPTAPPPGK
jgi:hypothetical protein